MSFKRLQSCIVWLGFITAFCACAPSENTQTPSENPQAPPASSSASNRPNILLIVVDDMGFSDIGSFGGEIETPNLDRLAYAGTRLTNFQVAPTCSPTRAMLLTGVDHHKAGLGNMLEELSPNQKGQPGYEGFLNNSVVTLSTLFQENGYDTMMSGKWHLGQAEGYRPVDRGFDQAFSLLVGGASHFGDMRPAYAPSPDIKAKYSENGKLLASLPDDFNYSSQYYVDRMIHYLKQRKSNDAPFFAYLSFTAPHWPLQAPAEAIAKYSGRYDSGYDELLKSRLAKAKQLGVIPENAQSNKAPPAYRPWDQLDQDRQKRELRSMEVYAAMIDEVDRHTGRLIDHLRSSDQLENTVIVFLSDNGAEGHDLDETWPADLFPKIRATIDSSHDFSFEQMGLPGSYVLYGHGWARAASPAFSLYKAFPTEGGTRAAAFIHYPKLFESGAIRDDLFSVMDIAPTLLDLAKIDSSTTHSSGRSVLPITGISMVDMLSNAKDYEQPEPRVLGTELFGKRALRVGDFKIVHMPSPYGSGEWQLFNLKTDLAERHDIADQYPGKFTELKTHWDQYFEQNSLILPDWVSGY